MITAGFALGLGFGWMAFKTGPEQPAALTPVREVHATLQTKAGTLADVERVFSLWGGYAVWDGDFTEIALWNPQSQRHDSYYEVRRSQGHFFFRTLDRLRRPLIDHGVKSNLGIQFTEPQSQHDAFHRDHPDYDGTKEPVVELPPRPPARYAPKPYDPRASPTPTPSAPMLTPGAGK